MEGKNGGEDKEQKRREETRKESRSSVKTPVDSEAPAVDEEHSGREESTPDAATTKAQTLETIGLLEQLQLAATALAEANGTDLGQQMDVVATHTGLYGQGMLDAEAGKKMMEVQARLSAAAHARHSYATRIHSQIVQPLKDFQGEIEQTRARILDSSNLETDEAALLGFNEKAALLVTEVCENLQACETEKNMATKLALRKKRSKGKKSRKSSYSKAKREHGRSHGGNGGDSSSTTTSSAASESDVSSCDDTAQQLHAPKDGSTTVSPTVRSCTTSRRTADSPADTTNADPKESTNIDTDANGRHGVNMSTPTTSVAPVAAASSSTPPAPRGAMYDGQIGRIVDSVITAMSGGGDLKKMRRIFRGALVHVLRIRGDTTACLVNLDSSRILHGLFLEYTIKSESDQVELGDDQEMKKLFPDEISDSFIFFTDQGQFVIMVRCFDYMSTSTMLGYGDVRVGGRLYTGSRPIGESDLDLLPEQRCLAMLFGPLHLNEVIFEEYMSKVLPSLVVKKLFGEPIFRITAADLKQAALLRFLFQGFSVSGIPSRLSDAPSH